MFFKVFVTVLVIFSLGGYGRQPRYIDRELFTFMEKGDTKAAAFLLKESCTENSVDCSRVLQEGYKQYEVWDFIQQPTPSLVKPKINIISSVANMAPSTVIHMDAPTAERRLTAPSFYRSLDKPGTIGFKYQMSPSTWLSACVVKTDGSPTCTDVIGRSGKKTSGGELLNLKKSADDFKIQFRFGCKSKECVLILRQIKMYNIEKSTKVFQQTSQILSDKAVEVVNAMDEMSPYTWVDRGFQGRDLSHLIESAIQQEQDELEMLNNPSPTPPPRPLKRRKYSPTTTAAPTTTTTSIPTSTTVRSTTCRPRTTTQAPESSTLDVDENASGDNNSLRISSVTAALTILFAVQTIAVLAKILGVIMAADKAQKAVQNALTGEEDQQALETLALMDQAMPFIEDFIGQLPIEDLTLLIVKPLILGGAYFIAKTIVVQNHRSDSPLYEMILRIKMHDDAVEKSSNLLKHDITPIHEHLTANPAFKFTGPLLDLETVIGLVKKKLPVGLNYDKSNDGPAWKIIYQDNHPKLAVDVYENWFAIENAKSLSNMTASRALFLEQYEARTVAYATILTSKKPRSLISSHYFQCGEQISLDLPIVYKFYATSPQIFVDICVKFLYSSGEFCAPRRNATYCLHRWCGLDFSDHFNSHEQRSRPFQITVKIHSQFPIPKMNLEPAVILLKWSMKDKTTDEPCQKVPRPIAGTMETNLCKDVPIPMIESHSFLLPTVYTTENHEGYSKATNVTLTGEWYKSSCALDFGDSLSKVDTPFTSLVSKSFAITVNISPGEESYLLTEELGCTTKNVDMKFLLSSTEPHLYFYICLYRATDSVTYACSHGFQSGALEYPNFRFESDFAADTIEISARSRDSSANGTMTILFEQLEVVC